MVAVAARLDVFMTWAITVYCNFWACACCDTVEEILHHMECVKPWENHGKHYQPQLRTAGFLNHARSKHVVFVACIDAIFRPMSNFRQFWFRSIAQVATRTVFFEEMVTPRDEKNTGLFRVFFGEKSYPVMWGGTPLQGSLVEPVRLVFPARKLGRRSELRRYQQCFVGLVKIGRFAKHGPWKQTKPGLTRKNWRKREKWLKFNVAM